MQKFDSDKLDFAYRYPFSEEAREIIATAAPEIDEKYLHFGRIRLENDMTGELTFSEDGTTTDLKYTYVLSYVYSRMLISAINNRYHLERFIASEAKRSRGALESESLPNIMKVLNELHINVSYSDERFIMPFTNFLMLSPKTPETSLVHLAIDNGTVYLPKEQFFNAIERAMAIEIRKKLPISSRELPKKIMAESKSVKLPEIKANTGVSEGSYRWIDRILATPIADVRHRTVNLILAPYLTNIKGLSEDDAAKIILDYIEKCKTLNPDTKVNATYVKYQCKYSKAKGMKPLSLERARELYKGVLELD